MFDSVPYFVVVRYRNPKLTLRMRFLSYSEANEFVDAVVKVNKFNYAVMPLEVKMQFIPELPN